MNLITKKHMKDSTPQKTKSPKDKIPSLKQKSIQDLTPQNIRSLKAKVHHLKPIVIVGNKGLTDMVIQEIDRALDDHELMKIRIHTQNREDLAKNTADICTKTNAILIHSIGHIVAIYRKNPDNEDN
jgi:RNA-binding protein